MSRDEPLLLDILLAANQALGFVAGLDEARFIASARHQNAVIRSLEVLGEAAARVSPRFRDTHPEIPWREMVGMRNRLIQNYANVSLDIIWDVLVDKLPRLVSALTPLVPSGSDGEVP